MGKERIDLLLVERDFFETRQKAKFALQDHLVYSDGQLVDKASKLISKEAKIEIKGQTLPFVSRGGLKLDKAIKKWNIILTNKVCMDIGASTGGFTDCMLQNRASKIYAIDVGHNQLAETVKQNSKVINLEGTNIKEVDTNEFEKMDFIGTDVSFISILHVLPKIYELLKIRAEAVILIKPQFEAGKQNISKTGVVKDRKIHKKVLLNVIPFANKMGFKVKDFSYSPIKGPAGNIEYLVYLAKNEDNMIDQFELKNKIETIVEEAFQSLK